MGELLLRKVVSIRDRIAKLRAAIPADPEDVLADERLEAFLSFHLFLLIQDVVDLAAHVAADRGSTVPSSQREVFEALSKEGLISAETGRHMAALASLRNRIAHAYSNLDPVRMVREAPTGLGHVERLLQELTGAIAEM